jgi:predicted ATPase
MIIQLEAYNYRCLREVRQGLGRFHVLIGRNASGKSAFLDVLGFLQDALLGGLDLAVYGAGLDMDWFVPRTQKDFRDLLHKGEGQSFTFALMARLPASVREHPQLSLYDCCRYQIRVGIGEQEKLMVRDEQLWLVAKETPETLMVQQSLLPDAEASQDLLWAPRRKAKGWKRVLSREGERAHFESEITRWNFPQPMSPTRLALDFVDEERFPGGFWFKGLLAEGLRRLQLNPRKMREPCPAVASDEFALDGSNLPKIVGRLRTQEPRRFARWLEHVQLELRDVQDIEVRRREEDNAFYLVLRYRGGYEVKQWGISEGSLRFLALTLLTYLPEEDKPVWLIEEPENGIHPQAVASVIESLSMLYESQVLIATHSPLVLDCHDYVKPANLLCFTQEQDATVVRSGEKVVAGLDREGSRLTLGDLMAWGVL